MADAKQLTAQVEKLLLAYNKDDTKAFYPIGPKPSKQLPMLKPMTHFINKVPRKLGEYQAGPWRFVKKGASSPANFLVVYFDGKFANGVGWNCECQFSERSGGYKFIQVQLAKKP